MRVVTLAILAIVSTVQASAVVGDSVRGSDPDSHDAGLPAAAHLAPSRVGRRALAAKTFKTPREMIPECAIHCIEAYILKHTMCGMADYKCICKQDEVKDTDAVACMINGCGMTKAKQRIYPAVEDFCKQFR